jgi:hypothetical protein
VFDECSSHAGFDSPCSVDRLSSVEFSPWTEIFQK